MEFQKGEVIEWIGCHALARKMPLVTRNNSDLKRIPGLTFLTYWKRKSGERPSPKRIRIPHVRE